MEDKKRMTVSNAATPFGCCNFFDSCTDGLFRLSYAGRLDLLDWLSFRPTSECYRSVEFIEWTRPESEEGGTCTPGYIGDPCTDPYGIEFGTCKLTVEDFGLLGRESPVRKLNSPKNYCKTRPRYHLDGTPVDSEFEWDLLMAMDVLLGDVKRMIVTGNSGTGGQFDGLQQWVATGYDCTMLDSIVVDWNENGMSGGNGITWNGVEQPTDLNYVDMLLAAHRHIIDRLSWAPHFQSAIGNLGSIDMILVGPSVLNRCLLDEFACWSVCPYSTEALVMKNAKEIREFRSTLNGGRFGHGKITLDGHDIDLLNYDWGLATSSSGVAEGDMYLLTGQVGGVRIWEGEFLSADTILGRFRDALGADASGFFSTDGGRVLGATEFDNLCYKIKLWMMLRMFCLAPWAQARFMDVTCKHFGPAISPDPCDSSFFPEASFTAAECQ
jgi:hypothetical protein